MRERVQSALNSKDKVILQEIYDEMYMKLSSSALSNQEGRLGRRN